MAGLSRWVRRAAAGYFVVAIFALGFAVATRAYPDFGRTGHVWVGILLAAPLVVAFVWDRLAGVKFAGVEVNLSEVIVPAVPAVERGIEAVIAQKQGASDDEAFRRFAALISSRDDRVLEIDLHDVPYWWNTRLFLVAAVVAEFTKTERIILLAGCRRYLGMCTPTKLRDALATKMPALGSAYTEARKNANPADGALGLVNQWIFSASFEIEPGKWKDENDAKTLIDAAELPALLGLDLSTSKVRKPRRGNQLLYYLVLTFGDQYVPIVKGEALECVADAAATARRISIEKIERMLDV